MNVHNPIDSAHVSTFVPVGAVLPKIGPGKRVNAVPALSNNRFTGATMPLTRNTPGVRPAQEFTDPIISNARLVNLAAEIERNLAIRKALRPMRSEAARKGWEVRNAR